MGFDKILYRWVQTFTSIVFNLVGDTTTNTNAYEFASFKLKETAFRIEGVFVPAVENTEQPVYFNEVQFQLGSQFSRRFFAEIFLYLRQNECANFWRAVVIYPKRSVEQTDQQPY